MSEIKTQYLDIESQLGMTFYHYEDSQLIEIVFWKLDTTNGKSPEEQEKIIKLFNIYQENSENKSDIFIIIYRELNYKHAAIIAQYLAYFGTNQRLPEKPIHIIK